MERGAIRTINWPESPAAGAVATAAHLISTTSAATHARSAAIEVVVSAVTPQLIPTPTNARDEAIALLRIAAEIEGALMVQYLFAAGSLLQGVSIDVPNFDNPITSDGWYDIIRTIAKQEMGHLITVQNLLLSLNASPHLDRENFPIASQLYPFTFSLQAVRLATLAKYVCVEAPHIVAARDQPDYADAVRAANAVVGEVHRAGQIYERLFWIFRDSDTPQEPWPDLQNPFPDWPNWRVDPMKVGFNQDRQAGSDEWRGNGPEDSADFAVYVLQIRDKASARQAIYKIGLQGEGPIGDLGITHFDKFLRVFREQRAVDGQPGSPAFARKQADTPTTADGRGTTITDPTAAAWANLGNNRYQLLLMNVSLALSLGQTGTAPSTTAMRKDFTSWAFREMLACIKPMSEELRQMPLVEGAGPNEPRAGLPFELSNDDLPTGMSEQLNFIRDRLVESKRIRSQIKSTNNPTPKQKGILSIMQGVDAAMIQKLGIAAMEPIETGGSR